MTEQNKKAFTLAEVLITLGIIGVVAAMTMPTLIQNHQKQVLVTQLKKSISTIEQGFQLAMAEDGVDTLDNTTLFNQLSGTVAGFCPFGADPKAELCNSFFDSLKKYFKIIDVKKDSEYGNIAQGGSEGYIISLADGAFIYRYQFRGEPVFDMSCNIVKDIFGGNMCSHQGFFWLDVNGKKGPNLHGRDIFEFYINSNGRLVSSGSRDYYAFINGTPTLDYYSCNDGAPHLECAARIIAEGWKMNY